MRKFICFLFCAASFTVSFSSPVSDFNTAEGIKKRDISPRQQIKMMNARNKYLSRDYKGALEIYMEIYNEDNKTNASAANHIGECYLALNSIDQALEFFEKAHALDPIKFKDIDLSLGIGYHRTGSLDKALEHLEKYKTRNKPKDLKETDVDLYIGQVKTAKQLMASPVDVIIQNAGENINSPFDDYAPSVSADGKVMIFTSRRPDTKGGGVDAEYDKKFFEDIYISYLDEKTKVWSDAEPIRGSLNSEGHDASLSISPSGREIYLYRNLEGETRSGDLFVSKLTSSGKWGSPKLLPTPINSSYFESSACVSADGSTLFFISERKGGVGNGDIYISKKIDKTTWGEPVNAGPVVNSAEDEISVFAHPDGKTLFFSSKGHTSMGGYDIFKTTYENGKFTLPVNVGFPINSLDDDLHFVVSADGKTGFYSSYSQKGFGERDIFRIDLSRHKLVMDVFNENVGILKGVILDGQGTGVEAEIFVKEQGKSETVAHLSSGGEGDFFISLPTGKKYELEVKKQGFKPCKNEFELPVDKEKVSSVSVNCNLTAE